MKFILLALLVAACSSTPVKKKIDKKNLVLVQGMHLDKNVWNGLKKKLNSDEFNITEVDRLGRDQESPVTLREVATLSCNHIPEQSIVVAHCFGGAIVNQMTGICPEKIKGIIYLSALVPLNGENPFDLMNNTDRMNYSKVATIGRFKIIPKEALTFFKSTDSTISDKETLPPLFPEWLTLIDDDVTYNEEKFNNIPKAYLLAERDKVLSLTTQFQYVSRTNIRNTDGLKAGHFSMLTKPEKVSFLITKWAKAL